MADDRTIMGIFSDEETTLSAVRALKETPWSIENVMSPIPSREIAD